jgi:UDP-N-acetylmuramate: L-alanyl-gamma-D-glutamyl-meso-diaminopimelate ligase
MKVHFIAIGGSAMHNLALALHHKGFTVTGSDDEILEPSRSRLAKHGLLPAETGWFPEKITRNLDAIILGMHARTDNPELLRAQETGVRVYSYPEYIYEQSRSKTRVVIGGSHGKTTITAMILHVLKQCGLNFDYMVGAQLEGFDTMVKLTNDAPFIILEGDEYLSSPVDRRPKFHLYKADIALLSGIAWDHINVFPTYESYVEQFKIFAGQIPPGGSLVYCENDPEVKRVCESSDVVCDRYPYGVPSHSIHDGITYLHTDKGEVPLLVFGEHNLMNSNGARLVCRQLGIDDSRFYWAIQSFKGASRRLELVARSRNTSVYKDFAHSPSKLKATTNAMKQQFPSRRLIACMELHTFSSLNENFLKEYYGSMALADEAIVYFNPRTIEHKRLSPITPGQVTDAFGPGNIQVFTDSSALTAYLRSMSWNHSNLLLMSSGNFDGMNIPDLGKHITSPAE